MSMAVSCFLTWVTSLLQTKCFLCGIGSEYFDKVPHGFEVHTLQEHNLANYLWVDAFSPSCLMLSQFLNLILKLLTSLSMLSLKMHTIAVILRSIKIMHLFCKITLKQQKKEQDENYKCRHWWIIITVNNYIEWIGNNV